jgi:hypothetical protein
MANLRVISIALEGLDKVILYHLFCFVWLRRCLVDLYLYLFLKAGLIKSQVQETA